MTIRRVEVMQIAGDVLVNLLDMDTVWTATSEEEAEFEGRDRATGAPKWTATRVDLVFGSNSQLRALAEVYAQSARARSSSRISLRPGPGS